MSSMPARSPCPPHQAAQGGGGPQGEVGREGRGRGPSLGPRSGAGGAGGGGRMLVVWEAGNAGPGGPFVPGGGYGHAVAVACVVAFRGVEVGEAGFLGVRAAPQGAVAVRVGSGGQGRALVPWGAGEAGAGASFRGGGGAAPFFGAGFLAGQVGQFGRRSLCQGGLVRFCWVVGRRG